MAKQAGAIPISGTIGNIIFYQSKGQHLARTKGGIAAERIATDPRFQRTREHNAEFRRAGKGAKLLRSAFRSFLPRFADPRMTGRLIGQMMKVLKSDMINVPGMRNLMQGDLSLLKGFEFTSKANIAAVLDTYFKTSFDPGTEILTLRIPSLIARQQLKSPIGATHFNVLSGAAALDFTTEKFSSSQGSTEAFSLETATPDVECVHQLHEVSSLPIFIVIGIEFLQEVNGELVALNNGSFNAMGIVEVGREELLAAGF